ncbi:NADAR family protein [Streptomyces roseoverticillatus]|uniref:NADAR family protein n=1 Tax=Streptomyces roseoverticillatus TaxID=66429 RepID=UPI001F36690B|nr:NADAR family protein [Streptomyces roseoverticillatus]MCF3105380.1 NADAR family protein [Streptomyces roseoverticillatus]
MIGNRITHRTVDGVRIPGTWRHAFICNGGHYFLTDLFIYADGLIDCWGLVTVEEFEVKLRSGWVATTLPDGAQASAHDLADWKFSEPHTWLTPDLLVAEVRDTIDQLNGRPDSTGRCLAAVDTFLADRTEENRAAARAAFLAIPASQRRYALGDMDRKDGPLRVLVAGPGGRTYLPIDPPVTQEVYDRAVEYFEERARWRAARPTRVPADGAVTAHAPTVKLDHSFLIEPVAGPGKLGLRNDYPAPITVEEVTYPSVAHAYWALSVGQPEIRAAIVTADTATAARKLAAVTPRREGWEHARTAVMTSLLRAKYLQHPELAEILLATDDATVISDDMDSAYWGDNGGQGRNWTGRLLELVRSDLHARRAGIPGL